MELQAYQRLDQFLVDQGHYDTRARARDAIQRGCVLVDGRNATKPSQKAAPDAQIAIDDPAFTYVSRAALKLLHGLEASGIKVSSKIALDIGASTGGFTQVLLEKGASEIFAIDVGHDQMALQIADDPHVHNITGLNCRDLQAHHLDGKSPQLLVCDVSFISLRLALPPALQLMDGGSEAVILIKPQFEVGREKISRGGLVASEEQGAEVAREVAHWICEHHGWDEICFVPSPLTGGDGNKEYLLAARKHNK